MILTIANLDFQVAQEGTLRLDLAGLGLPVDRPFEVIDLLDGTSTTWTGNRIPIELDPAERGAHVLWLRP